MGRRIIIETAQSENRTFFALEIEEESKPKQFHELSFSVLYRNDVPWYQFNATLTNLFCLHILCYRLLLLLSLWHPHVRQNWEISQKFSLCVALLLASTDKLKSENSKVFDNWPSLIEKLQSERDLARENSEFLSTLQDYFIVSIFSKTFYLMWNLKFVKSFSETLSLPTFILER